MSSHNVRRATPQGTGRRPADLDVHDLVALLREVLGSKLLALTVDVDPKTIDRWATDRERGIRSDSEQKLRHAYQLFHTLQEVEAPATIRAWFMGMNPQIDDLSPAEAIQAGRQREAMAAARAFVSGG